MLAGADSIDDLDLLRHGGMGRVFSGVRAPSTVGTFLRCFTQPTGMCSSWTRSTRKAEHVACPLVVRRVKRLHLLAGDGSTQGELFATYRHHALITTSALSTVEAHQRHRDHALIEQVIAELKDNALAHLPSASYAARAAWVACAVIAFTIAHAAAVAADQRTARWATLRARIINVPARIAATSRRLDLHLPQRWPWARSWKLLSSIATAPPPTATT